MTHAALTPESPIAEATPRGRIAFGLTPRALALLLAGVLFLVPAFLIRSFAWGMVAWDVLLLLLILRDFFQLPSPGLLRIERTWLTIPSQGVDAEVEISLEQASGVLLHCRLIDDLPPAMAAVPSELKLTAFPNIRGAVRYRFKPKQRGDHMTGKVFVRYRSTAGLVERWAAANLAQQVRVYPYRHPGEDADLFLARMRQIEQQLRRQRIRGLGRDFESLRDYREGDDLRDVCWTATARRGTLVTKQYQVEKSQRVWLVMDAGRLLQAEVGNGTKLDYAASTSLALSRGIARLWTADSAASGSRPRQQPSAPTNGSDGAGGE
jgi:uncharacterized protein (DUF58 family)